MSKLVTRVRLMDGSNIDADVGAERIIQMLHEARSRMFKPPGVVQLNGTEGRVTGFAADRVEWVKHIPLEDSLLARDDG